MAVPTINSLFTAYKQKLETELGVSISSFGRVFLNAFAAVQAAKLWLLYIAIEDVRKNLWVDTADQDELIRFGLVKLGRQPQGAVQAVYDVAITGGNVGQQIPANSVFKANDDSDAAGQLYILDNAFTIVTGTDTISLRALEGGLVSRLSVGNKLTSTSPLTNANDEVTVGSETTEPIEAEDIEDYREDVIQAFQTEAQGGSAGDYRIWSADAAGVRRVYPYKKSGVSGEIDLFVEANPADSTDGFGTPSQSILDEVEAVVEKDPNSTAPDNERSRRPLGAVVNFLAASPKQVTIVLNNAVDIDSVTEAAIQSALDAFIFDVRPFIDSAERLEDKNDILDINRIILTVQDVLSGTQKFDSITLTVDGSPVTTSVQFIDGDIPYLGSLTIN